MSTFIIYDLILMTYDLPVALDKPQLIVYNNTLSIFLKNPALKYALRTLLFLFALTGPTRPFSVIKNCRSVRAGRDPPLQKIFL